MAYDPNVLAEVGSQAKLLTYWNAAAPHLQARFCHASLGTKIKIERIGNLEYFPHRMQANVGSEWFENIEPFTVQTLGSADLVLYITCVNNNGCGGGGLGWLSVVCGPPSKDKYKSSTNEYQRGRSAAFASVTINFFTYSN